jgi:hypothetical protein
MGMATEQRMGMATEQGMAMATEQRMAIATEQRTGTETEHIIGRKTPPTSAAAFACCACSDFPSAYVSSFYAAMKSDVSSFYVAMKSCQQFSRRNEIKEGQVNLCSPSPLFRKGDTWC